MEDIRLELNEHKRGKFYITEADERLGLMDVGINNGRLVVYHTEVLPKAEGKGFAKKLLEAMVDYARKHQLKVLPLCPYVLAQFKRHPGLYEDIWEKIT